VRRAAPAVAAAALLLAAAQAALGAAGPGAVLVLPAGSYVQSWSAQSDNRRPVAGQLRLAGKPVAGAVVRVDGVRSAPTGPDGGFAGAVDSTTPQRHLVSVADVSGATVAGQKLTSEQASALLGAKGAFDVSYRVSGLKVAKTSAGIAISGTVAQADKQPVPTVRIYSYRLTGRITDSNGRPVKGAIVSTRTEDRDYWTVSEPSDAQGRYVSLFTASDESTRDPVPFAVRVAVGDIVYGFLPDETVYFKRTQSAIMNLRLPPPGFATPLPASVTQRGAVYQGVLGGTSRHGRPVRPVSVTGPDAKGRFTIVLPAALAGSTVTLFEALHPVFSHVPAVPGGAYDLSGWPAALDPGWPDGVATVRLPG
jgi:hypothetical protein